VVPGHAENSLLIEALRYEGLEMPPQGQLPDNVIADFVKWVEMGLPDPRIGKAGDVDTAVTLLRFESGAIGTIDNSRQAIYGYDQRVEVFGSGGAVSVANNTPDAALVSDATGVHGARPLFFFLERYAESFIAEMREFVQAVQQDKTPPVTGMDGRIPVVMALAANRSLRENRPVKVTEIA